MPDTNSALGAVLMDQDGQVLSFDPISGQYVMYLRLNLPQHIVADVRGNLSTALPILREALIIEFTRALDQRIGA